MQEQFSDLSRRYREEMLRMYGKREEVSTPQPEIVESQPPEPLEPENNPDFTGNDGDYQDRIETPFPEEYEEPTLPDYIRNGTEPVLELPAAEQLHDLTGEGFLRVAVQTGEGAFPVDGASVTVLVRRDGKQELAYLLRTDESGETPRVSIPAPPAAESQQPQDAQPFTTADVRVFANGYFRAEMRNVPVFAGITSLQTFQLIPLPVLMHEDMEVLRNATESPDL